MSLPEAIAGRLRLPLIAAPMLRVSGPELVSVAELVELTEKDYREAT